jgi:isoquinoline 1-oxidoreductase beta subunit
MEPMNSVAKVSEDGQSAEIWTGTQFGALAANIISGILKTTPDKIKVNQQMLGGGYGRRIWPDAAIQATILSNITKRPVKLILTREDDVAAARPRPMTHHVLKAGLDANGNLVGWHHRLVSENVDAVAAPPRFEATGGKDYIRAGSIRRSTASAMCGPSTCVKRAACAFTPGAGSARATTSSRPNRLWMRLPTRRARIRSPCGSN